MTISARCVMTCTGAQFMQTESSPRYSRQVCQINADTHRVMLHAQFSQQLSQVQHAAISVVIVVGYRATILFQSELRESSIVLEGRVEPGPARFSQQLSANMQR